MHTEPWREFPYVTAATGALGPTVAKLGALLGSEYKLRRRRGTRKDVKFIKSKLQSMHSILWKVWERKDLDKESKDLKKEALDLAADLDDAIDDFILGMERSRRNKLLIQSKNQASPFEGFKTRVNDVSGRCCSKWKWKNQASPFEDFKTRVNGVSGRCCSKWEWKNKSAEAISSPSKPPPRAPFVLKDVSELVGMDELTDDLVTYLVGGGGAMVQPQLKMASIVGMGGIGKTTIARLVYDKMENEFPYRAFVSVTPCPNMMEVLTSILEQAGAPSPAGTQAMTEEHIIHTISNFLKDKRYLVIIDDIWHRGEWEIIRKCFPENNLCSRIVMTTRIDSVPGDDFDNNKLYNRMIPKLSYDERKWYYGPHEEHVAAQMVGEGFDSEHPLVRMCFGVPLALHCMFEAMAKVREQQEQQGVHVKARDVQDMIEKQVKQSGIQNTQGLEPLVQSLQLDYDDLPHHMLKTCLLYCSIYPENYEFHRDDLAMRWVAEGFTYKEDAAKGYFEELCNRGLMLPKDSHSGAYQMNPMMRNFLGWKSREDSFITWSSDVTSSYACRSHRLCIDDYPDDDDFFNKWRLDWSQMIRSLVVFEGANRLPFEKLQRVRVLDLQFRKGIEYGNDLENRNVKDICGLLRLRHLFGLERRGISEIPPEIARLQYLETLQVRGTNITELPREIGRLQKLKTLDVGGNVWLAELPREIGDLQHLETLCMNATNITEQPWKIIGKLKKLKTLDVSRNRGITELPREIGELQHLETLDLTFNSGITNLPREIGKLQHLKTLKMDRAGLTELPPEIGNLQNLETLDLSWNEGLTELPREIGKLQNLKRLHVLITGVKKIPRSIGGMKKLEILEIDEAIGVLPWEAGQLSKLEGVPECVRQAWKNSDLVSCVLAGEILSIQMIQRSCLLSGDRRGLIVGTKQMQIPQWIEEHFNDLRSLDIRICKLEEKDHKILREMPKLEALKLRFEVVPRKPIAIIGEGFLKLRYLVVDSRVPRVSFEEGAMPMLERLCFEFQFYGGPPNTDRLGINHLRELSRLEFKCNKWYRASSPCISAMIDVVREEAQEHPRGIGFDVSGSKAVYFPPSKSAEVSSNGTSEIEEEIQA